MRLPFGFLRARLGRRIALLFFLCAAAPLLVFAGVTLVHVRGQLLEQSGERLATLGKEAAQGLTSRLHVAALVLERADASGDGSGSFSRVWKTPGPSHPDWETDPALPASLAEGAAERVRGGEPLLVAMDGTAALGRLVRGTEGRTEIAWATLRPDYLRGWVLPWESGGPRSPLPAGVELCLLGPDGVPLAPCRPGLRDALAAGEGEDARDRVRVEFRWESAGERWLSSTRLLFLRAAFGAPEWRIVVSEPASRALAPVAAFERTFLLATLLALLVVPFLSQVQIRRNLEPLRELQAGTRRIAERDFRSRIHIESGDEFEDLGASFNAMAERLGRQFGALATANEIDRAILGAIDTDTILETALERGPEVLPGVELAVVTRDDAGRETLHGPMGAAARADGAGGWERFPVRLDGSVHGAVLVRSASGLTDDDRQHAGQLADRLAVALSNARLVRELERMNMETIAAFARAIDAKSHWTAGHSERVTALALELGRELGLPEEELEILHRGGLLHDIGKIGIPGAILDKAGPLDDDEFQLIRAHPAIGARIVQPIARFQSIVPIVRHHHERYDGLGYPDRLAGEEIPLLARVVAVADVYDALRSERPYRAAMPLEKVARNLAGDAGTAFDPAVIAAFERVLARTEDGLWTLEEAVKGAA